MIGLKRQYIPEWLEPHKNHWLTTTGLNKIIRFKKDDEFFEPHYLVNHFKIPNVKKEAKTSTGYKRLYLVKQVVVMLKVHGYEVAELPPEPVVKFVERIVDNRTDRYRVDIAETRVTALQQDLMDTQEQLGFARTMVRWALSAKPVNDEPGVYFLCNEREVVYVGKASKSVKDRVNGRANLVSLAKMLPMENVNLDEAERRWIKFLKPKGNTQHVQ